ncbi:cystine/glutamate transporter [Clonorchis sinensis]|uniref:Cystine/glutamate transporter n=1 Tax=Clonorchis sinensis TaxID=79923 RepID=G7YHL9_CLOSI|nr:cystine/glutamate transporter [Clonorchis sinensis]
MPAEMEPLDVNLTARENYLEQFGIWCLTKSDMDNKKLTAYFLHSVGKEAYTLIKNLVYPETPIDISYNELEKKVLQLFKPINFVAAGRARFNMLTRSHSQSVRDFVLQLQTQAAKCDYGAQLKDQLRDRLIAGIQLPELQQKLLLCPDQKSQTIRKTCSKIWEMRILWTKPFQIFMPSQKEDESNEKVQLKQDIGILKGVGIVVGIIVGSGIFLSPVGILRITNSIGLSFVMWIVTGLFSTVGAIVYAELGVTIPRSGGEYIYILETFGPFLGFMALWITFFVIGTVSCAINSLVLANYVLKPFFPACDVPASAIQLVALIAVRTFLVHLRITCFFSNTVLHQLLSCCLGDEIVCGIHGWESPGFAAYSRIWEYLSRSRNYLNFLTGEMKNPARNLPIVIALSMSLVTVIYILANVAYLAVLSPYEILNSDAVAVAMANRCMGVMAWTMPVFVGASVFGSINGEVLSMSRLCFTGAEEGHMPTILSMVSVTNLTPIPSILAMVLLSIFFQFSPDLYVLIEYTGLAFTVVSGIAVCTLIHIKRNNPGLNKTKFKLPMFLPILYLIVNFGIGIFSIYNAPLNSLICLGLMAVGMPLYVIGIAWKTKPRVIESASYKFTITMQKIFNVVQQEPVADIMPVAQEEENDVRNRDVLIPTPTA